MTAAETLLGIALPASADEIKKAYRRQIARYHPDKVQHLGEEFQVLAAEKSAQLTDIYQRMLKSGGADECVEAMPVPDAGTSTTAATQTTGAGATPPHVNRMSTWQAVAVGCPSLILVAAVERMTQSVRWSLPSAEEFIVTGFSLAWRTRPDWRSLFKRRPAEGVLLRTPTDSAPTVRQRPTRLRDLLPDVDGAIVMFDLVLGPPATSPHEPPDRAASLRREPDVFTVTVDAMTWKARVPPQAPELAHVILARLRDARV